MKSHDGLSELTEENFGLYIDISYLPAGKIPCYIKEGFCGLCTGGTAQIEVFSNRYNILQNDLLIILPSQLVSITGMSDDFSIYFFKVSKEMFSDIMSGLCRMTPDFFFYMRKNFVFHLTEEEILRYKDFCTLLETKAAYDKLRRETVMHLLRVLYWHLYMYYINSVENKGIYQHTNKEGIAYKYILLVMEYYKQYRDVAYYADKLCISPKYLTTVTKGVLGLSARDCIIECTILEMKALLRNATLDIKDVVRLTEFPSQTVLSRYFRKYTGMSPSEYRKAILL